MHSDVHFDCASSVNISRVDLRVICVDYKDILVIDEISLMSIALVSVKVNYKNSLNSSVLPQLIDANCNIRVDTKPPWGVKTSVMVAPAHVDAPAMRECEETSIDSSLGSFKHWIQNAPSHYTCREEEERNLDCCWYVEWPVQEKQFAPVDPSLK